MARVKPLSPTKVASTKLEDGLYADGDGLYLRVRNGRKTWQFRYELNGRSREMGFGAVDDVGLAEARELRRAMRKLLAAGKDPLEERRLEEERRMAEALARKALEVTFAQFARDHEDTLAPKSAKLRKAWLKQMTEHVGAEFAGKVLQDITMDDVLKVLKRPHVKGGSDAGPQPYWLCCPEGAERMRMRIEHILTAANAKGVIPDVIDGKAWKNPAVYKGRLEHFLADQGHEVQNHASMDWRDVGAFMQELRALDRPAAKLVEFVILTCVRNGEARQATWGQIDWEHKVWILPKEVMKMKREHLIPLAPRAVEILESLRPENPKPGDLIFWTGASKTGRFSENACQDLINDMGLKGEATTHGFRATFKTWAWEQTRHDRDMVEMCLSHAVAEGAEGDYWRGDALLKRLAIYKDWEAHLAEPFKTGEVEDLSQFRRRKRSAA